MISARNIFILIGVLCIIGIGLFFVLQNQNETTTPSTDSQVTTTDSRPVVVSQNLFPNDNDRDGISNEEEQALGLDPTSYDTDLDGLADSFELNVSETDPTVADTDGDGIPDGREYLVFETDPNSVDSDGDGFDDATEIDNGYNPNGPGSL